MIEEINDFLPEEFIIALPLTRRGDISIEGTVSYVNKVKVNFDSNKELGSFESLIFSHSS